MAHRRRADDLNGRTAGPERPRLSAAQAQAVDAYFALSRELFVEVERRVQEASGLSTADGELVRVLLRAEAPGIRPTQLARAAGWPTSRVAHHLRRLERRGVVTRTDHPDDGRGRFVALTARGREQGLAAEPVTDGAMRDIVISALSEDELVAWGQACARVLARVREVGGGGEEDVVRADAP